MTPDQQRTEFRLSARRSSRDLIAFAVIAAGVLGWTLVTDETFERRDLLIVAGASLLLIGVWNWRAARLRARAEMDRTPQLSFGDDGVLMPQMFDTCVPWDAIRQVNVYATRGSAYAAFRIDRPERFGFRPTPLARLEYAIGFGVRCSLRNLDGDVDAVEQALRRHAPARLIGAG